MVKVKVFCATLPSMLQNIVNKWLLEEQQTHDIYIINTTQSESEYTVGTTGWSREIIYTIIYKVD